MTNKKSTGKSKGRSFPADIEAASFRSRNMVVYPGKVLVVRADEFALQPIEDEELRYETDSMIGVSLWGPLKEYAPGTAALGDSKVPQYCVSILGDVGRDVLGTPILDTWIARADVLRWLILNQAQSFGQIPLRDDQIIAGALEIYKLVRSRAVQLVRFVPPGHDSVKMALAKVADSPKPGPQMLTEAILHLMAFYPSLSSDEHHAVTRGFAEISNAYPTSRDLLNHADIKPKSFQRIRTAAGINHGLRGHNAAKYQYTPAEVMKMIEVVRLSSSPDRERILSAWIPYTRL